MPKAVPNIKTTPIDSNASLEILPKFMFRPNLPRCKFLRIPQMPPSPNAALGAAIRQFEQLRLQMPGHSRFSPKPHVALSFPISYRDLVAAGR